MRNDLLFIDGELVDLDDSTKITLNYKSNLFTDLSKIVSNNSYTIKLPKTVRNQRVIKHADLPACSTDYPRKYHSARYIRNGVEIIPNGKAVFMSGADSFEVALIWGNISLLSGIVGGDKTLNDLKDSYPEYYTIWKREFSNYQDSANFIMADMNMGVRNYDSKNYVHPCVRAGWILERISQDSGINFLFPNNIIDSLISRLLVPMLTKKGKGEDDNNQFGISYEYDNGTRQDHNYGYVLSALASTYKKTDYLETVDPYKEKYAGMKILKNNTKIHIRGRMFFNFVRAEMPNPRFVAYKVVDGDAEEVFSVSYISLERKGDQDWFVSFEYDDYTTLLDAGDVIYFAFADTGFFTNSWGSTTFVIGLLAFIEDTNVFEDGVSDGYYPIISNLPSVKQIDFLKALSAMSGTFAVVKNDITIQFVSMDEVISNKGKAIDWTRKVVASYQDNKPKTISFSLDGFAQKNIYKWKEDSSVSGSYDGYIYVNDETIEASKDSVTLSFAATDMRVDKAYIPIYEYGDNDEVGKLGKVDPRILLEINNNGKSKATFSGLGWSALLSKNYQSYQKVVRNPVIITEKIEISDIDLKELDVTVPVYLGQYGRYYALISVKAEDTGVCECKLLQLEV
ncbi:hypothetical protein [Bacteroides cellulosilyticus]|uniref:hypothetical protein n=1 Tax=Bacteroides cellulosilyticus TaxID=246787 RepID=UPI0032C10AD3